MKFDAIVGNPPYQEMDGGGKGYSAKPVYNYFVGEAKAIEPHYISMITPSRWFSGGKGLDDFRAEMLQDKHLRKIVDYADNEALFSNVSIETGQPPSGGCELKPEDKTIVFKSNDQPPSGGCELKHIARNIYFFKGKPAAFGRL